MVLVVMMVIGFGNGDGCGHFCWFSDGIGESWHKQQTPNPAAHGAALAPPWRRVDINGQQTSFTNKQKMIKFWPSLCTPPLCNKHPQFHLQRRKLRWKIGGCWTKLERIQYFAFEDPFLIERLTSARSSVYLSALPVLWVSFLQLVACPCSAHRFIIGKSWNHVEGQNKRLYPHCSESPIYQQQKGKWESYSVFIVSLVGKLIKRAREANSLSRKKSIRSHH